MIITTGCCDLTCKRERHAIEVIQKVEEYFDQYGYLPDDVSQIGLEAGEREFSFYKKISETEYEVWYGMGLGESKIYNSKTKEWRLEG